ncbi:TIGR02450 family Trp-rich protein [Psychromonas arctica]|uniref:TIGR02450 family Trp-rich protein n=1 Tax=Psychromonas arctica TaxID=168275 RepID=A0ABU9HAV8_9GAMM
MNKINPKKLLRSKWTAVKSINKEKHFLITEVDFDEDGGVILCLLEAIISRRTTDINWHDLKDTEQWLQGWK